MHNPCAIQWRTERMRARTADMRKRTVDMRGCPGGSEGRRCRAFPHARTIKRGLFLDIRIKTLLVAGVAASAIAGGTARAADAAPATSDIVVTAERANRTLRETSSSVVVSTREDIDKASGVYSLNDLLGRIPNILATEPGNDMPAVRGVDGTGPGGGPTAFFAGGRPRFSYLVDGRTLSFNEATFGDTSLWDIDQVEVYRGPQSTLLGRNAIAGVVAIRTADPSFDWRGAARGTVGNRDETRLSGAVGGPIVPDVLAFRASADWQRSQDFIDFAPYPRVDNPGRYDTKTFRGKLLLTPSPGLRSLLTVSYQDGRQPQSNWVKKPYQQRVSIDSGLAQPVFRARTTTGIADTSLELGGVFSLQLLLSATDFRIDRYAVPTTANARIDGTEYLVQPLLRYGTREDRISGFVAAYVFRSRQDETNDLFGGGAYRDETDTNAVFGEITVRPADTLSVIVGARYEEEKRFRLGATGPLVTDFRETYKEFLPKATVSLDAGSDVTLGVSAGRGYNAGGSSITLSFPFQQYTYEPEYVWSYEGFVRAGLGSDISLTGNIFYSRYKDMQLPYYINALSIEIRNAERAKTYGAELGVAWRPSPGNELYANAGLLETRVDRYDADTRAEGNELPRAPAFSLAAGFSLSPDGAFELGADVRYSSAYFSEVLNDARGRVDPYAVVNGRVAYNVGPARLFFTVRNLLNSGSTILKGLSFAPADDYAVLLEPRKVSAGVELRF